MKKILVGMMCAGFLFVAACGSSSGGGGGGDAEAEAATETFLDILEGCGFVDLGAELAAGMSAKELSKALDDCPCPGGGTIDVNAGFDTIVLTATNCQSLDGQNFDGEVTINEATESGSIDFTDFGDNCGPVEAPNLNFNEGSCSGTITADCDAGTATCTIVEPQTPGEGCDVQCS